MGIDTRKVHGYSQIKLKERDFSVLLTQYGIAGAVPPIDSLPHSTERKSAAKSIFCEGSELGESNRVIIDSLPMKKVEE